MKTISIQELIDLTISAFRSLPAGASLKDIEDVAIVVHRVMMVEARSYHTLDHVFGLADRSSPVQTLAALFHDLVYYQVDQGIQPDIFKLISPFLVDKGEEMYIASDEKSLKDRTFNLTLAIFGFKVGEMLHYSAGLNEFTSALFAAKRLQELVPEKEIIKITACIEATIPFRAPNQQGENCFYTLEKRLYSLNEKFGCQMTVEEIEETVKRAVLFANKDVKSFCEKDPAKFLNDTWNLLPETNYALRARDVYSVRDYRQALEKVHSFLSYLNPDTIFHNYRGVPTDERLDEMACQAHININIGVQYLGVKLFTMALLEALSEITGGDVPISYIMGEIPRGSEDVKRIEKFLPPLHNPHASNLSPLLTRLLKSGWETPFDLKNSPVALFVYQKLGPDLIEDLLDYAREMFAGKLSPEEFLNKIDGHIVAAVADASAVMMETRSDLLSQYARKRRKTAH